MKTVIIKPLLLSILISGLSHAAEITLRFQSYIKNQATTLGDVLHIENAPHHWENLRLESHPSPGEIITKDKMMTWMTQRLGPFKSKWQGKTRIQVMQSTQSSGKLLIKKANIALSDKLKSHYQHMNLKPLSHPNNSDYAVNDFKVKMSVSYPVSKRVCVWLIHKNSRIPVWFKVKAYRNVLVAKRDLHSNTPIQDHAFSWKKRNIAGLTSPPAKSLPNHLWLTSPLKRDEILLDNQLKHPPLIIKGQAITVTVHHHAITLVVDGVAITDGSLGQVITVKNPRSRQTFVATISGVQQAVMNS